MLRIRGKLYLGRGITDTGSDPENDDEYDEDEDRQDGHDSDSHDSLTHQQCQQQSNLLLLVPTHSDVRKEFDNQSSLLEKILTGSPSRAANLTVQQQQQIISKSLSSGGSVEIFGKTPQEQIA